MENQKFKYILWISKEKDFKFLSQHDFLHIIKQALRRSNLPIILAGKYNPHIKISFFSAVSVGVSSKGEPIIIELKEEILPETIQQKIQTSLPSFMKISKVEKVIQKHKNIKFFYQIKFDSYSCSEEKIQAIKDSKQLLVYRKHKKKEEDIRPFIENIELENNLDNCLIHATILFTPRGSISPWEILDLLNIDRDGDLKIDIQRSCEIYQII